MPERSGGPVPVGLAGLTGLTGPGAAGPEAAQARIASELDDALYYLRRGCVPCAERHFDLARSHGATAQQVGAVVAAAAIS